MVCSSSRTLPSSPARNRSMCCIYGRPFIGAGTPAHHCRSCASHGIEHVEVAAAGPPEAVSDGFEFARVPTPVLVGPGLATQNTQTDRQLLVQVCSQVIGCGCRE